jgi:hypothetical protein
VQGSWQVPFSLALWSREPSSPQFSSLLGWKQASKVRTLGRAFSLLGSQVLVLLSCQFVKNHAQNRGHDPEDSVSVAFFPHVIRTVCVEP